MSKRQELLNYLDSLMEDENIVGVVVSRDKQAEGFLNTYKSDWQRFYNLYRCKSESGKQAYHGRANLFVPLTWSAIETIHPRLCINKPSIILAPRGPEDLMKIGNAQQTTDYYLEMMRFKKVFKEWVKTMLITGISVLKLDWYKAEGYNGPRGQVMDLAAGDFKWDPMALNLNDSWCIHTYEMPIGELKKNKKFKNTDKITEGKCENDRMQKLQAFGHTFAKDAMVKNAKITEYWGPYDLNKDGIEEKCKIVIANDTVVLQAIPNPMPHKRNPFILIKDFSIPNELIATGEIEPLESLQYELNDLRNQRMDNVTAILHRMWKIAKGADVNQSQLNWRPNGIVEVGDMEGLAPIDVPDVTRSSYNEEQMIKSDFEYVSGLQDMSPAMGTKDSSAGNTTARGMAMQQEMSNPRFQLKLDNIEDGMIEFGEQLFFLIKKFMPDDVQVRMGEPGQYAFRKLTTEDIDGLYDIKVEMGTTQPQNRITRRAEARELFSTVAPLSQVDPEMMKATKQSLKYLIETYDLPETTEQPQQPQIPPTGQQAQAQGGISNMGMESMYGQMGANMGGAMSNNQPSEIQGLTQPQ